MILAVGAACGVAWGLTVWRVLAMVAEWMYAKGYGGTWGDDDDTEVV